MTFLAPTFFGLAHVHHAITQIRDGIAPAKVVIIGTIFQFLYTYLFGMFVSYVALQEMVGGSSSGMGSSGNLYECFVIHSFCNYMGVPNLDFLRPTHVVHWAKVRK